VELYHWSLYDIDRTDIESLLDFVFHRPKAKATQRSWGMLVPCDMVSWL